MDLVLAGPGFLKKCPGDMGGGEAVGGAGQEGVGHAACKVWGRLTTTTTSTLCHMEEKNYS